MEKIACGSCSRLSGKIRNRMTCKDVGAETHIAIEWSDTKYSEFLDDIRRAIKTYDMCFEFRYMTVICRVIAFKVHPYSPVEHEVEVKLKAGHYGQGDVISYYDILKRIDSTVKELRGSVERLNVEKLHTEAKWIIDLHERLEELETMRRTRSGPSHEEEVVHTVRRQRR